MKKKITLLLSLIILIPCVVLANEKYVNYYGIEMSEEEYNNLVGLGFTENEIYYMLEDDFNYNKDIESKLESSTTNYYVNVTRYDATGKIMSSNDTQISEDEYNMPVQLLAYNGYIETSYKKMTTTISKSGDYYRAKVNLVWKTMPAVRSYDIIGLGFDPFVYVYGDLHFSQTYCITVYCKTSTKINNDSYSLTGAGVSFELPSKDINPTSLESTFYFDLVKDYQGTLTEFFVYGDYAHAVKNITGGRAQGFGVYAGGIELMSDVSSYYDSINPAIAKWNGSW